MAAVASTLAAPPTLPPKYEIELSSGVQSPSTAQIVDHLSVRLFRYFTDYVFNRPPHQFALPPEEDDSVIANHPGTPRAEIEEEDSGEQEEGPSPPEDVSGEVLFAGLPALQTESSAGSAAATTSGESSIGPEDEEEDDANWSVEENPRTFGSRFTKTISNLKIDPRTIVEIIGGLNDMIAQYNQSSQDVVPLPVIVIKNVASEDRV